MASVLLQIFGHGYLSLVHSCGLPEIDMKFSVSFSVQVAHVGPFSTVFQNS